MTTVLSFATFSDGPHVFAGRRVTRVTFPKNIKLFYKKTNPNILQHVPLIKVWYFMNLRFILQTPSPHVSVIKWSPWVLEKWIVWTSKLIWSAAHLFVDEVRGTRLVFFVPTLSNLVYFESVWYVKFQFGIFAKNVGIMGSIVANVW